MVASEVPAIRADGNGARRITTDRALDLEPIWGPDGTTLYVVSDRGGEDLDIFGVDPSTGRVRAVVGGAGNQIQPDVSPDGRSLAYVSPVEGRPGSGGL